MLDQKQILTFAVKGIELEIEKLEKAIKKGYKLIADDDNGKAKAPKPKHEILAIITKKDEEKQKLEKAKFEIEWKLEEK